MDKSTCISESASDNTYSDYKGRRGKSASQGILLKALVMCEINLFRKKRMETKKDMVTLAASQSNLNKTNGKLHVQAIILHYVSHNTTSGICL